MTPAKTHNPADLWRSHPRESGAMALLAVVGAAVIAGTAGSTLRLPDRTETEGAAYDADHYVSCCKNIHHVFLSLSVIEPLILKTEPGYDNHYGKGCAKLYIAAKLNKYSLSAGVTKIVS